MAVNVPYIGYDNTWKHKMFSNHNSIFNDKKCNIDVGHFTVTLYGDSYFSNDRMRSLFNGVTPDSQLDFDLYGQRPKVLNLYPHTQHSYPVRLFNFSRGNLHLSKLKMT